MELDNRLASPGPEATGRPDAAARRPSDAITSRPRTVSFAEDWRRVRLPGVTPAIGKPWNMNPVDGAAVGIDEHDGRLRLRYATYDGGKAELLARPVPLAQHNPGDEVLLAVAERDAAGCPVYKLAVVRVD